MLASANVELSFPTEWEEAPAMMMDEELSSDASNSEEDSKVLGQWETTTEEQYPDFAEIMEVDAQIGSNLLGDDIFYDSCVSPTSPMEELTFMSLDEDDVDRFSLSLFSCDADTTSSLPFEERYKATLQKLAESMKRSQETRKSLKMKTDKTEEYPRNSSVSGVLMSIENSTQQLQGYLKDVQRV